MIHPAMPWPAPASAQPLPTVLACGAWLKNTACLLHAGRPMWSVPHGDLSDPAACERLVQSVEALLAQTSNPVRAVAHDLHPDFFSTQLALNLAQRLGVPAVGVQHHHAHIAAVLAEHGLNEQDMGPVVGLALDGVGLGTDGTAWGGELLWVHGAHWQRLGHLSPLALPGGDRAATEPWRMAASTLHALGRGHETVARFAPLVGEALAQGVQGLLAARLNCPSTTSAGRWFDAAAGALWRPLGLGARQTGEAQAAQALQAAATRWLAGHRVTTADTAQSTLAALAHAAANACGVPSQALGVVVGAGNQLDLRPLLATLFDAPTEQMGQADAAAAHFHLTLADGLAQWAATAALAHGTRRVCLGGGCWANTVLRERVVARLQALGLQVFFPNSQAQGCGDAGLALGQAWVVAQQLANAASLASPATVRPVQPQPQPEFTPCV